MLNVIHVHLNDMADDVTFEVAHMKPGAIIKEEVKNKENLINTM